MTMGQLQMLVAALRDNEATREVETIPKLDQVDRVDIEATREGENVPKLDQVDQVDIEATREGEAVTKLDQGEQVDTGGEEQNKAKAKSGDRKEGIGDNGVKDCGKRQN